MTDLSLFIEKTIFDSKSYRAGEHEHLGAVGIARRGDRSDVACQRFGRPEESLPRGVIEFNADWGNRTYGSGQIVARAVCQKQRRHGQHDAKDRRQDDCRGGDKVKK